MFQFKGNATTRTLTDLHQGQIMTLLITDATENCVLEFQHNQSATWHTMPGFNGNHVSGVVVQDFRCVSGKMRVRFLAAPSAQYEMSLIATSAATF